MPNNRSNGITIGIVSDLEDPEQLGRVKLTYPQLDDQESQWARLSTPMAGPDRGVFFRPEVEDEVLVAFEQGDVRRPYILGSLWSTEDQPPADDGNAADNNWRFIKSRSGHIIKLNDTDGSETIEIIDKSESHKIIIDTANQKIQIICDSGDIEVSASSGKVKIDASEVEVTSSGSMKLEASGEMTIKGATVNIN